MVIDGLAIITALNFITAAERRAENLLVIHDRALAARYTEIQSHAAPPFATPEDSRS
jgi:hypothetical protein